MAGMHWRISGQLGQRFLSLNESRLRSCGRPSVTASSPRPNMPMAIGTKPMPSPSSEMSMVIRGAPVLTSIPTRPSSRPTSTMATAFSGAPCASTTAASVRSGAPRKKKPGLAGVSATAKPVARLAIRSPPALHSWWPRWYFRPDLDRQSEHRDEQKHRKDRERDRQKRVLTQPHVVSSEPGTDHHREAGQRQTHDRQQHSEQRDRCRDQQQRPPRNDGEYLPSGERRAEAEH